MAVCGADDRYRNLNWYRRHVMRTALNLDAEALASAMKVSPGKTKTDIVNEALREYARRRRLQGFLEFRGRVPWEGDIDELRGRSTDSVAPER